MIINNPLFPKFSQIIFKFISNKKSLNKPTSTDLNMKSRVHNRICEDNSVSSIKEAQKDPEFLREINKFIKASTRIYKLY